MLALAEGETLNLRPGRQATRRTTVRMLGYNGSIPGPTLKVRQGSEIAANVTNDTDIETTVHWQGLESRYDGVPHETEAPIPVGGSFGYRLQFPTQASTRRRAWPVFGRPVGRGGRLRPTYAAETRVLDVQLPGVRMKVVGGDSGRMEHTTHEHRPGRKRPLRSPDIRRCP